MREEQELEAPTLKLPHPQHKHLINLSDVRFTKGADFDFPPNTMIGSDEFLLVVRNQAAFESRYGTGLPIAGEWEPGDNLGNDDEQLKLSLGTGTAIHDFIYLDLAPWPTSPDGPGYSLTLRDPAAAPDHSLPENWRASAVLYGSPGSDDTLTYAGWAAANFTTAELLDPAISGIDANPDHDGLSNFAESYFNGLPKLADPSPGIPGFHDGFLSLIFTRRNGAPAKISPRAPKIQRPHLVAAGSAGRDREHDRQRRWNGDRHDHQQRDSRE